MDTFVEQIVVKKKGGKEWAIIAGILVAALILAALALLLGPFALLLIAGIGYGAYWLITSQNIEYEYSVTNGDIDIDQIIARRKRKRIVSVSGQKIESMQPYKPEEYVGRQFDRTVIAAPSAAEPGLWCFTYSSKKNGRTMVVFQPEERVLSALKAGLTKLVQLDMNRKLAK